VPDALLFPDGRQWPTICVEIGYTEPYQKLLEDASLLLEGSKGRIGLVILIKVTLKQGEIEITEAFVEVWKWTPQGRKKRKGRLV
jgi:hypothetical protein